MNPKYIILITTLSPTIIFISSAPRNLTLKQADLLYNLQFFINKNKKKKMKFFIHLNNLQEYKYVFINKERMNQNIAKKTSKGKKKIMEK